MGCFDSVWHECENCGARIEWQSKAHDCDLRDYYVGEANIPLAVTADLDGETQCCPDCGLGHKLEREISVTLRAKRTAP